VAHQVLQRRRSAVRRLRERIAELQRVKSDDYARGYRECLLDILTVADADLSETETRTRAEQAIATNVPLKEALYQLVTGAKTATEIASQLKDSELGEGRSEAQVGRYLAQLRALGLATPFPGNSRRERPYQLTPLGEDIARKEVPRVSEPDASSKPQRIYGPTEPAHSEAESLMYFPFQTGDVDAALRCRTLDRTASLLRVDLRGLRGYDYTTANRRMLVVWSRFMETFAPAMGRYDHDKFFVLVPNSDANGIRQQVETLLPKLQISVNVGIADTRTADIVHASEQALLASKEAGDNLAKVWPLNT
jgi:hypothetical protein